MNFRFREVSAPRKVLQQLGSWARRGSNTAQRLQSDPSPRPENSAGGGTNDADAGMNARLGMDHETGRPNDAATDAEAGLLVAANEKLVLGSLRAQVQAESAVQALQEVTLRAEHDPLTQLPNRVLLMDRFAQAIAAARRNGGRLAVLFLDLDGFKQINDEHGHAAGDQVLQVVAQRLVAAVRGADTVSRHGGDEFLILLTDVAQAGDASLIADKVLTALAAPARIGEQIFCLSGSIGVSIYPDDHVDAEELIRRADAAMYNAKRQNGGSSRLIGTPARAETHVAPRSPNRLEAAIAEYEARNHALLETNRRLASALASAQEAIAAAEQARRQQTEFMILLAHDLCTPLAPAHATVAELERIGADQPLLGQAQDALDTQVVDIAGIVDEAVDTLRPTIVARRQHLSVSIGPRNPEVLGDPIRLAQAMCNLLENASKYTQKGGEIAISVAAIDGLLRLAVADNGRGIDAATLPAVFDPFVRGANAADADSHGLGLGLTLVRQFVEAHGGQVAARSAGPGLGSEFVITLPLAGASVQPRDLEAAETPAPRAELPATGEPVGAPSSDLQTSSKSLPSSTMPWRRLR